MWQLRKSRQQNPGEGDNMNWARAVDSERVYYEDEHTTIWKPYMEIRKSQKEFHW